jgi:hypothetical protein
VDKPSIRDVMAALEDVDYPAGKDDLLAAAERHGADDGVLRALRSLPLADYLSRADLMKSVPVVEDDRDR